MNWCCLKQTCIIQFLTVLYNFKISNCLNTSVDTALVSPQLHTAFDPTIDTVKDMSQNLTGETRPGLSLRGSRLPQNRDYTCQVGCERTMGGIIRLCECQKCLEWEEKANPGEVKCIGAEEESTERMGPSRSGTGRRRPTNEHHRWE